MLGPGVARAEGEVLLVEPARRVTRIELDSEPEPTVPFKLVSEGYDQLRIDVNRDRKH